MAGADGQLRFHVRDGAGNVIWPAVTRIEDGPYYEFNDEKGGKLHEDMLSLSQLTIVEDWFTPPYDPKQLKSAEHGETGNTSDTPRLTEIISFKCSTETKHAMRVAASDARLDVSAWLRKTVAEEMARRAETSTALPSWVSERVQALLEKYRPVVTMTDALRSRWTPARDLHVFLRAFIAHWERLDGLHADLATVHDVIAEAKVLWPRICEQTHLLGKTASASKELEQIGNKLNATRGDLRSLCRDLREQLLSKGYVRRHTRNTKKS